MSLCLQIKFNKSIYKDINTLYFIENNNIIYYDGSHMNYIYNHKIDNIDYIFHGFFKDGFFVIIFDSYDNDLSVNIVMKYIILLKLKWTINQIKMQNIYIIDSENMKNYKIEAYIFKNRKNINNRSLLNIDDYFRLYDYTIVNTLINPNKINKNIIINKVINLLK
jgi:hypothetical protein